MKKVTSGVPNLNKNMYEHDLFINPYVKGVRDDKIRAVSGLFLYRDVWKILNVRATYESEARAESGLNSGKVDRCIP